MKKGYWISLYTKIENQENLKKYGITPRMSSNRIEYVEAKCTRCNRMFEDVPAQESYKDPDLGTVFICEDCLGNNK